MKPVQTYTHSVSWTKIINRLVKLALLLLFGLLIYNEVVAKESLRSIWDSFLLHIAAGNVYYILAAMLLVPANWAMESMKWRALTSKFDNLTFKESYLSILCGLSIGIFTPQRIGEYGGRILLLQKKNSWKGVLATFISSISQNIWNVSIGLIAAGMYLNKYVGAPQYIIVSYLTFAILLISCAFYVYYNLDTMTQWVKKVPFLNQNPKVQKLARKRNIYTAHDLTQINILSFIRYGIYAIQYILLLYFFGVSTSFLLLSIAVSTIYLVQSSIPIPPMFGILARAEIALIILGVSAANELSILSATFTLWIINLLIPSFLGLLVVLRINVLQPFTPAQNSQV